MCLNLLLDLSVPASFIFNSCLYGV